MNIHDVMTHLEAAAKALEVKSLSVERGADKLERFTRSPGVLIYPTDGTVTRDGSKMARTPGTPYGIRTRRFVGRIDYAVRFLARDDVQLGEMVSRFLEYLFENDLHDAAENYIAVPSGDIRFMWRDPEGVLIGNHAVELVIPADAALYSDRARRLIDLKVEYELATSLEGVSDG